MKSAGPGPDTSRVEASNVTADGFCLRLGDEELVVTFAEFPWFRQATVAELERVERPAPDHLYWPLLDIDLAVESIRHPGRFPLVSRVSGRG
jgi:hypothetical protein